MPATVLVSLLLLAVPITTFSTNVYYVTADDAAGHDLSCPSHQICHNLSYYISQPAHYFTNNIIIVFLEGQHSFDREDLVQVNNVHNLTLKGQGEWPVAGPEETVMQSTVIINCTRGRGGFIFDTGYDITIEGLTITNCGDRSNGVFLFANVGKLYLHKNSIQNMLGYGLTIIDCETVNVANCSWYRSFLSLNSGAGISVSYARSFHDDITCAITYSNFTKCHNPQSGGGIYMHVNTHSNITVAVILSHLMVSQTSAGYSSGCLSGLLHGDCKVSLQILNSIFYGCNGSRTTGCLFIDVNTTTQIIIRNSTFIENTLSRFGLVGELTSELVLVCRNKDVKFYLLDSKIVHTKASNRVVYIETCQNVIVNNTQITMANQIFAGFHNEKSEKNFLTISNSRFEGCYNLPSVILITSKSYIHDVIITNSIFSNNSKGHSVFTFYKAASLFRNCTISNNSMTGITAVESNVQLYDHNVIQNNRYTEGAGITLSLPGVIAVKGELYLLNNTAVHRGGAILVLPIPTFSKLYTVKHTKVQDCTLTFHGFSYSIILSGNKAGSGGDDIYGATLNDCEGTENNLPKYIHPVGKRNETSYYFYSPLMKYLQISRSNRLSSMSSDPIMVCFCDTSSNLPDCSDRIPRHIQTYPGLEINTTIATVGYYGGTSPGVVQVSAQHAKLVHFYGQNETIKCFQLQILLQNSSSTTALVDIKVEGGLKDWGLSLTVDILECPMGFVEAADQISGQRQCHCIDFLVDNHVQCNVSLDPYKFLRSGNSWFAYINNTQTCITGTTNCPFDYCNRSNVSFGIMAPDHQCLGNRTGILCGQCQSHLSIMLGSNRCGTCSNWYLFLLPVFALAGIVLVAVLMFLNLSVSVGTINGLLFYANMVKLNEAFFFPNGSIPVVSQFISWLNLDLGIEVCLFDGLDGYWSTWLQFAFPAYLFLLMGGIIVGCRYSVWLCRLCGSHAVPALATLFLMSYTKILLTVTNALSMSQLPCNDSIITVWSVDGNIEYGSGKHLVLVIVSCGVLVVGLGYPVLVLCAPLLERYSHKCIPQQCRWNPVTKLKPLLDAYGGPYKDKCRFWTGVTLMVRLTLTVTFSFTSGRVAVVNAYVITTVIVGILIFWSFTRGVYRNIFLTAVEAFYLFNMFLLSTFCLAFLSLESSNYQIGTIISVGLCFLLCLATMAIHIKQNFDFKKIKRKLGFRDRPEYIAVTQVAADEDDEPLRSASPPSMVYGTNRGENQFVLEFSLDDQQEESLSPILLEREPLLFDANINF